MPTANTASRLKSWPDVLPVKARTVVEYGRHRGARRTRMDATAWVDAGIEILVRQSIEKVGVEQLAKKLGVTKGSFYWHFRSRAEFLVAILDRWTKKATVEVVQRVDRELSDPGDRFMRLLELPFWSPRAGRAADLELAIRAWARRSTVARNAVQKVDVQRLAYLKQLFGSMGLPAADAESRAHIFYGIMRYLGQLRDMDEVAERAVIRTAHNCLVPRR
jgi:AcrR family transcriptional regulator